MRVQVALEQRAVAELVLVLAQEPVCATQARAVAEFEVAVMRMARVGVSE
jgi:hypothetical protein